MIFPIFKSLKSVFLSLISALFFTLAWPSFGFAPFIFIAFVPLLWILENQNHKNSTPIFYPIFWTFLLWNIGTTWWICKYNLIGGSLVITLNALCMSGVIAFFGYLKQKKIIGNNAVLVFVSFWLSWEWIHQHWDLSWPWLNLGNVFATMPKFIQWYQFTGVFGGSLWVLLINFLLFKILSLLLKKEITRSFYLLTAITSLIVLFPISYSFIQYGEKNVGKNKVNILIIQQNTNPATEQNLAHAAQIATKINHLVNEAIDSTIDLVVIPESALVKPICEDSIPYDFAVAMLINIQHRYPNSNILVGATLFKTETKLPKIHKKHNAALFINNSSEINVYSKSRLVPGVETYPFEWFSATIIKKLLGDHFDPKFENNNSPKNLLLQNKKILFAPIICYESIYGGQIAKQVKNGAQFLTMITNDGWWDKSDGYRQHLAYAQLRAIETQQPVVRAANTGISAIIEANGSIVAQTSWNTTSVIRGNITPKNKQTFYVKNGDYILRIANFVSLFWIISFVYKLILNKKKKPNR